MRTEMQHYRLWIDGAWTDGASGETIASTNPYSGEVWATVPRGNAVDVDRAVRAAHRAMTAGEWATMTATQRGHALRRLGSLVAEHAERLAAIEVRFYTGGPVANPYIRR